MRLHPEHHPIHLLKEAAEAYRPCGLPALVPISVMSYTGKSQMGFVWAGT